MRLWAGVLAAVALLCAGPAAAQGKSELPRPADGYFQETVTIADGVWALVQPRFVVQPAGNVTIIEQADGLVLVDAGGSPGAARRVVQAVRRLSGKPVKAVVITHWHGDHPQGLAEILQAWPNARTIATRATRAHLADPDTMNTPPARDTAKDAAFRKQVEGFAAYSRDMAAKAATPQERAGWAASARLFAQYGLDMAGATTIPTAQGFDERLALPDPDNPVEVLFLGRANTDGDAVVWLRRRRVLVTGDVVVAPIPFGFGSYPAEWLEVLGKVRAYDFEALVPGHGRPMRDRSYLDGLSALIAEVRRQVGPLAAQGLALEEVRKRVDFSGQAQAFAGEDPWLRRWFQEYWVSPIVASAYKEARGEPIVQSLRGG